MYKAIFVDIDGTLVNNQKNILPETKNDINMAKENGIEIIICSGRQIVSATKFKQMADASRYMICNNGAVIYDYESKNIMYSSFIDKETCHKMNQISKKYDLVLKLDCQYGRFIANSDFIIDGETALEENPEQFINENDITQISFCTPIKENIEKCKEELAYLDIKIAHEFMWEINGVKLYFMNCNNKNISKGNTLEGLCKYLKIDLKDVVAIGDGVNDISMIEKAGLGVAMGNATDDVKQVANFVTTSNEENGVGKVIEKILLEGRKN